MIATGRSLLGPNLTAMYGYESRAVDGLLPRELRRCRLVTPGTLLACIVAWSAGVGLEYSIGCLSADVGR